MFFLRRRRAYLQSSRERVGIVWRLLPGLMLLVIPVLVWHVAEKYRGSQAQVLPQEDEYAVKITSAEPTEKKTDTKIDSGWVAELFEKVPGGAALTSSMDSKSLASQLRDVPILGVPCRLLDDHLTRLNKLRRLQVRHPAIGRRR